MEEYGVDPVISVSWLKKNQHLDNLRIIDCRWSLTDKNYGYNAYLKGHVPGAIFLDVEKDLSDLSLSGKGRHPFPSREKLRNQLEKAGISDYDVLVAYDDDASGSARLWFLLQFYSFTSVHVLDGGISAWINAGGLITREVPSLPRGNFTLGDEREEMIVEESHLNEDQSDFFIIDSRANDRYSGKTEPIDSYSGHLPGAHNVFWKDTLNSDSTYRNPEELKKLFNTGGKEPVVYCGSGITSCVSFIALLRAGMQPKLFPGGWSQWSSARSKHTE